MTSSSNPDIESKLRRIERYSSLIRAIASAIIVPIAILVLVVCASPFVSHSQLTYFGVKLPVSELTATGRVILSGLALVSGAVVITALVHLRRLMDNYSRREIFTADSARQLRKLGVSCMVWGVVKAAWGFMPLLVLAQRGQPVRIESDTIMIGFVIVLLSWFAEMAAELRAEADLTI